MSNRSTTNWMAWAQLVRAPNLFTAVADPFAGWLIAGGAQHAAWELPVILVVSLFLYAAGMVLNDCFDYHTDCRERPNRPVPRGAINLQSAWINGWSMLVAGLVLSLALGSTRMMVVLGLALAIVTYNAWAKKSAWLGPLIMGLCRFLNFTWGMGGLDGHLWMAPVALAGYVIGLSVIARTEVIRPENRIIVKWLLQGIVVVDAVLVAVFTWPQPDLVGAALVASLLVPVLALSRTLEMT
jgi:4-hydroxybenzoate polyprenyltransferase